MKELLKRRGIFSISRTLIEESPKEVAELLSGVLIVGLENDFMTNKLIYRGYSDKFDLLEDGEVIPHYNAIVNKDKSIRWQREKEYTENDVKAMLSEILKNFNNGGHNGKND